MPNSVMDSSGGDWSSLLANQLAHLGLRCCDADSSARPDLKSDVWKVLEPMRPSSGSALSSHASEPPSYFVCPILQEVMEDPHVATDGYTYEAEALRQWLDRGNGTSPMTNEQLENTHLVDAQGEMAESFITRPGSPAASLTNLNSSASSTNSQCPLQSILITSPVCHATLTSSTDLNRKKRSIGFGTLPLLLLLAIGCFWMYFFFSGIVVSPEKDTTFPGFVSLSAHPSPHHAPSPSPAPSSAPSPSSSSPTLVDILMVKVRVMVHDVGMDEMKMIQILEMS